MCVPLVSLTTSYRIVNFNEIPFNTSAWFKSTNWSNWLQRPALQHTPCSVYQLKSLTRNSYMVNLSPAAFSGCFWFIAYYTPKMRITYWWSYKVKHYDSRKLQDEVQPCKVSLICWAYITSSTYQCELCSRHHFPQSFSHSMNDS